jgi:hypothetical protein
MITSSTLSSPTPPVDAAEVPEATTGGARLSVTTDLRRRSPVDGAWWPRSHDAAAELPALIATLDGRLGHTVQRAGLSVDTWQNIPRKIAIAGRVVKVGWFHAIDPAIISLTLTGAEPITLLVIPPDTAGASAAEALRPAACDQGRALRPVDILTAARPGQTPADDPNGHAAWDNEGGSTGNPHQDPDHPATTRSAWHSLSGVR